MQPCSRAAVQPCSLAAMQPCSLAALQPCSLAAMQPCRLAAMPPCSLAAVQPCSPQTTALQLYSLAAAMISHATKISNLAAPGSSPEDLKFQQILLQPRTIRSCMHSPSACTRCVIGIKLESRPIHQSTDGTAACTPCLGHYMPDKCNWFEAQIFGTWNNTRSFKHRHIGTSG